MPHLIRGTEYLKRFEGFKLFGRDKDIERISSFLMKKNSNSLLLVGPAGVGTSALILGLQYSKELASTPFDIKSKRLFWLDTDTLFSNGDGQKVNDDFQRIIKDLSRTAESVLVIEDTAGFIERSRDSGNPHFINALNVAVKAGKTQVILEVRDEKLQTVLEWHNDIGEAYTLYDVKEPTADLLKQIVTGVSESLVSYHVIPVSEEAIVTAIELTSKYRDNLGLGDAQPKRAISLLDHSLSVYRQNAHRTHPILVELDNKYNAALAAGNNTEADRIKEESTRWSTDWDKLQAEISRYHSEQRKGEDQLYAAEDELQVEVEKHEARKKKEAESGNLVEDEVVEDTFESLAMGGFDPPKIKAIKDRIKVIEAAIAENSKKHDALVAKANYGLALRRIDVILEFSQISGFDANKLSENELENLRNLENNLLSTIYGQDAAVKHIADSIKVAKLDSMSDDGPAAAYMLMGPSGVGKTFIAKTIAKYVMGDESALVRFDMSEYQEKHAVARFIGAPPGYEGYERGGILINTARKRPVGVYLFDEAEKAHPEIYDIFLQILSEGHVTDGRGITADFSDIIIIFTSNIGQEHYLNEDLTEEQAAAAANLELEKIYRAEFLNRFNGRENILHFKRLSTPIIERIMAREFKKLDASYAPRGLRITISEQSIKDFVDVKYDSKRGARGLPGYLKANLRPVIVNQMLATPNATGTFEVVFDREKETFLIGFVQDATVQVEQEKVSA